jgi:hypothetical protein
VPDTAVESPPVRVESSNSFRETKNELIEWMDETGGFVLLKDQRNVSQSPVWMSTRRPADIPAVLDTTEADRAARREQLRARAGHREQQLRDRTCALTSSNWDG